MNQALNLGLSLFRTNSSSTSISGTPTSSATATVTGNPTNMKTSSGVKVGSWVGVGCGGAIMFIGVLFLWGFREKHSQSSAGQAEDKHSVEPFRQYSSYDIGSNASRLEVGTDRRWETQELEVHEVHPR